MYFYPSDEGLYSQFLCVCDQLLDRHPRQEGASFTVALCHGAVPGAKAHVKSENGLLSVSLFCLVLLTPGE